jgi:2-amino-4-deoxychorismate synthase
MSAYLADLAAHPAPPPFALIRRQDAPPGTVDLLVGTPDDVLDVATLAELPLPAPGEPPVLALVPFRQVGELGFDHHDDGTPLRCLRARHAVTLSLDAVLAALPADDVPLADAAFDVDDDAYAETVKRVVEEEIGRGEGANFVIRRELRARQPLPPARAALAVLRRLLEREVGAYWTFAAHLPSPAGDVTVVGATPERHVSARGGEVVMNPISGTFRYPAGGPTRAGLLDFLRDTKEVEELFMVVDEELKMMSRLCDRGGRVLGPFLKPMGHLAHTEYLLTGRSDADPREVLRATMFAATVTGSPLENACRVITRHEPTGRGYYSGMAALLTAGADGPELDAPILIRTAYLAPDGGVRVPVGATLVRHSVPEHEVAETHAKVAGLLSAFRASGPAAVAAPVLPDPADDAELAAALAARNAGLAPFWLQEQADRPDPRLAGRTALIVDAEDAWTAMLAHALRRQGMDARVVGWAALRPADVEAADLLLAGPGPGDPRDLTDRRVAAMTRLVADRLAAGRPLLAVCLSHQILAGQLGLPLGPLARPYQGTQRRVPAFGRQVRVGFYNTYAARAARTPAAGVEVFTTGDDEVVGLRGPGFASVQFHLESVLSPDGVDLLRELVLDLVVGSPAG